MEQVYYDIERKYKDMKIESCDGNAACLLYYQIEGSQQAIVIKAINEINKKITSFGCVIEE